MSKNHSSVRVALPIANKLRLRIVHRAKQFFKIHRFIGSGVLRNTIERVLMPTPTGPTITPTLYGFDLLVDPVADQALERTIYYNGTYEAGTLDIIGKCLCKGDIFIDVGSNIGLISLFSSKLVGPDGAVYSFEPEPVIYAILRKNIEINRVSNVHTYDLALGSARTTATIYSALATKAKRGAASLIKPSESHAAGATVKVQTLDEFVCANKIANVRMLKIDVEGWELEVLKGARHLLASQTAPIICIEYSNLHPIHHGQALDIYNCILAINDYKVYKLEKGKETISKLIEVKRAKELPWHDNLFCFLLGHLKDLDENIFA